MLNLPPPDVDETLHLKYYVLSLVYVPPGNASSVSYENTAGVSHRVDISNTLKAIASVEAGPVTAEFQATDVTGHSYQLTSSSSNELSLDRHTTDLIPADEDVFVLEFGTKIRVTRVGGVTTVFTPDLLAAEPVRVTTAQLKNPALMDPFTTAPSPTATRPPGRRPSRSRPPPTTAPRRTRCTSTPCSTRSPSATPARRRRATDAGRVTAAALDICDKRPAEMTPVARSASGGVAAKNRPRPG